MKKAGGLCKIDSLGRIVIPAKIRGMFDMKKGGTLEIYTDENGIVLKKYIPTCVFCGADDDLKELNEEYACTACIEKLSGL